MVNEKESSIPIAMEQELRQTFATSRGHGISKADALLDFGRGGVQGRCRAMHDHIWSNVRLKAGYLIGWHARWRREGIDTGEVSGIGVRDVL